MDYTNQNSEYLKLNPNYHLEDSRWKSFQILKCINRNNIYLDRVADVGCGAGEILSILYDNLPESIIFEGYEISKDAYELSKVKEKDRLKFYNSDMLLNNVNYDLLLMIDVFEHVKDYLSFLENLNQKSKYKLFHIPLDISVLAIFKNDFIKDRKKLGHLHYFNKNTAIATVEESGMKVIDYFYTPVFEVRNVTIRQKVVNLLRRLSFIINKDFSANLFGGYSLIILAR
jgi:SAM-dependent methyltransferase